MPISGVEKQKWHDSLPAMPFLNMLLDEVSFHLKSLPHDYLAGLLASISECLHEDVDTFLKVSELHAIY